MKSWWTHFDRSRATWPQPSLCVQRGRFGHCCNKNDKLLNGFGCWKKALSFTRNINTFQLKNRSYFSLCQLGSVQLFPEQLRSVIKDVTEDGTFPKPFSELGESSLAPSAEVKVPPAKGRDLLAWLRLETLFSRKASFINSLRAPRRLLKVRLKVCWFHASVRLCGENVFTDNNQSPSPHPFSQGVAAFIIWGERGSELGEVSW